MTFSEGDGDDLEALEPGSTARPGPRSGPGARRGRSGCLAPALVFAVCALVGFVVAASVRGNDDDGRSVELEEGSHDGRSFRIEGVIDEQGAECVYLFRNGELNTGGCDTTPGEAIVGGRSVIFGQAPARAVSVRIPLSNGDRGSAEVQEKDGFRWYSFDVDQEIDIDGEPTFVNAEGGSN